jgi:ABC-type antimicrobial peptide transport system permease subunit
VTYAAARRSREMAIRKALGASGQRIVTQVLASGATSVAVGGVTGTVIALLASSRLEPLLFETSAREPVVYALAGALLLIVTAASAIGPARRCAVVEPQLVLRGD